MILQLDTFLYQILDSSISKFHYSKGSFTFGISNVWCPNSSPLAWPSFFFVWYPSCICCRWTKSNRSTQSCCNLACTTHHRIQQKSQWWDWMDRYKPFKCSCLPTTRKKKTIARVSYSTHTKQNRKTYAILTRAATDRTQKQ